MNNLKSYKNLYVLYHKTQKKILAAIIIFFAIFLLSFVVITTNLPIAIASLMTIMILPAIIMTIFYFVLRSAANKSLSRFTENELSRIDRDLESTEINEGYAVTRDALVITKNKLFIYPLKDIVWIYKNVTSTKLYGILTVSKSSEIIVAGKDHKRYYSKVKNKSNMVELLKLEIDQYNKNIIYGYAPELETMFRKNFNQMLTLAKKENEQEK